MLEDTCNRFTCESKRHDVRSTVEKLTLVLGFINTKKNYSPRLVIHWKSCRYLSGSFHLVSSKTAIAFLFVKLLKNCCTRGFVWFSIISSLVICCSPIWHGTNGFMSAIRTDFSALQREDFEIHKIVAKKWLIFLFII